MRAAFGTLSALWMLLAACDKPPPNEHVYTGKPLASMDASVAPSIDAAVPVRDASGDAASDGGSNVDDDLAAQVIAACGARPSSAGAYDTRALLGTMAQCARREYCEFGVYERAARAKVEAYVAAPDEATALAAQRAWRAANAQFQRVELFRFGPAAPQMEPGGQNLRAQIYAFPVFDRCLVDEQTVNQSYADPSFGTATRVSGRGLAALEYLLFYEGLDNGCSSISAINVNKTWAALSADELRTRRRNYAAAVVRDITTATGSLIDAWDPAKGNFTRTFSEPGNAIYASERDAFNALGYALYYVEQEVKDLKLAIPLGISLDCPSSTCPERVESPYALASIENIRGNLSAFRAILQGCGVANEGLGLDDALRAKGPAGDSLATRIIAALDSAEREAQAFDVPLELALAQQPARVMALYNAIKGVTDLLKTELITLLDIQPPMSAEGDND